MVMSVPRSSWLVFVVALMVACRGDQRAASRETRAVSELRALAHQMCACRDRACADAVAAKTRVAQEHYREPSPTASQLKEVAGVVDELTACRERATGQSAAALAAADAASELGDRVAALRDAMCACKDARCAGEVDSKLFTLLGSGDQPGVTGGMKFALEALTGDLRKCRLRLTGNPEPQPGGDAVAVLTAVKDRMCACRDRACADREMAEMTKLAEAHVGEMQTEEQKPIIDMLTRELMACMAPLVREP